MGFSLKAFVPYRKHSLKSTFFKCVLGVIFRCSQEQMLRVDANSVVTNVANQKTVRNISVGEFPSYSGSYKRHRFTSDIAREASVAVHRGSVPTPTIFGFGYVFPKQAFDGLSGCFNDCTIAATRTAKRLALFSLELNTTLWTDHLGHRLLTLSMFQGCVSVTTHILQVFNLKLLAVSGKRIYGV
jgi:hypothetical protein